MFQFGIRTLLIVTTAVAVIVWVLFAPPQVVGVIVLFAVHLAIPPVTIAAIVYDRGYWQAFFLGAAPWIAATSITLSFFLFEILEDGDWVDVFGMRSPDAIEAKLFMGPPLVIMLLSGLAAMAVRWWVRRRDSRRDD